MQLNDPASGQGAGVNRKGQLAVESGGILAATLRGDAWSWISLIADIDTGDTALFVKNLSEVPLILTQAFFEGSNVIAQYDIKLGNATTAPAGGSVVAGVNLSPGFLGEPAVNARTDETAVADGGFVRRVWTPITNQVDVDLSGIVLRVGEYIQFNQFTESSTGSVGLFGYFDPRLA